MPKKCLHPLLPPSLDYVPPHAPFHAHPSVLHPHFPTTISMNMQWWLQPCQHTNYLPSPEHPSYLISQQSPGSSWSPFKCLPFFTGCCFPKEPLSTPVWGQLCHQHIPGVNLIIWVRSACWFFSLLFLLMARLSHSQACGLSWVPFPLSLPPGPDEFHHVCLKSFYFQLANLILVLQNFGNPAKLGARCRFNEHIFSSFFPVCMKMLERTGSGTHF